MAERGSTAPMVTQWSRESREGETGQSGSGQGPMPAKHRTPEPARHHRRDHEVTTPQESPKGRHSTRPEEPDENGPPSQYPEHYRRERPLQPARDKAPINALTSTDATKERKKSENEATPAGGGERGSPYGPALGG